MADTQNRTSQRRLVAYDGDCGFCMWLLAGLLRWDRRGALRSTPLQGEEATELLGELDPADRMASWHLISPRWDLPLGGDAIPPLLRLLPGGRLPAAAFARFPGATSPRAPLGRRAPDRALALGSEDLQTACQPARP